MCTHALTHIHTHTHGAQCHAKANQSWGQPDSQGWPHLGQGPPQPHTTGHFWAWLASFTRPGHTAARTHTRQIAWNLAQLWLPGSVRECLCVCPCFCVCVGVFVCVYVCLRGLHKRESIEEEKRDRGRDSLKESWITQEVFLFIKI